MTTADDVLHEWEELHRQAARLLDTASACVDEGHSTWKLLSFALDRWSGEGRSTLRRWALGAGMRLRAADVERFRER